MILSRDRLDDIANGGTYVSDDVQAMAVEIPKLRALVADLRAERDSLSAQLDMERSR